MAGLDISFDDIGGHKAKQKRQQEAAALAQNLLQHGAEPEAVNQIANSYINSGNIQMPAYQKKMLPYDPDVPEGRSTLQPFALDQKKKGLFGFNTQTGKFAEQPTPEDMTDFEVKSYTPAKPVNDNEGHAYKIDQATGARADMGTNGKTYDTYVYWDSTKGKAKPPSEGGKDTPDVVLAKQTMKKYQDMLAAGTDVPDPFMDSVRSAADKLNIDMADVNNDPSTMDSIVNSVSSATGGLIPAAKPKAAPTSPRFTPKSGKPLTKDLAAQFLQQSGGDKNKARALAKAAGYTF